MDHILDLEEIRVYSLTTKHRREFVERLDGHLKASIYAVNSPAAAVKGADVIQTATNSLDPVVREEWIIPGTHISSIRSTEVSQDMYPQFDVMVVHSSSHQGPRHNP